MAEAGRRAALLDGRLAARLTLAGDLLGWTLVLARPDDTFARGHQYDHLAAWASEDTWALIFGLGALALVLGIPPAGRLLRWSTAALGCALQACLAVTFGGGPVITTGFGTHLALALVLCVWLVWRELFGA